MSITDPFDIADIAVWLDPTDTASFTFSSGDIVSNWADQVSARGFAQGTGSAQPIRTNTVNGNKVVDFDGTEYLRWTGTPFITGTACTVVVFGRLDDLSNYKRMISFNTGGPQGDDFDTAGAAVVMGHENAWPACTRQSTALSGTGNIGSVWAMMISEFDGTNHTMYVDGVGQSPVASTAAFNVATITVAAGQLTSGDTELADCAVGDVIIYNRAINSTERADLFDWLGLKWLFAAPDAPTITSQAGGHLRAGVEWTAGSDGGSAITDWDIDAATAADPTTWLGVQATGSTLPYGAYTGLTNGTAYVFRVRGVNAVGDGAWSGTSGSATPTDDRGFFLLESGDKFLLESGDKFLLESGAGAGGTDATATPAAIAATVAMDAATISAGSTPTPATIVATVTQNAATTSAGSTPTPATIIAVAALDAVVLSAGSTPAPAVIVAPAAMDAVSLSAGAGTAPAEIVAAVTMDAVAAEGVTATAPNTIAALVAMDAVTPSAGSTPTPATIVATVTMDAPTIAAGSTVTPAEIVALVAMDAATLSAGSTPTPAAITATVTIDAVTPSAGSTSTPAAIVAPVAMDAATISAGSTATPVELAAAVTMDAASLSAGSTPTPATIVATVTMEPVAASGSGEATATPAAIVATVTIDAPTLSAGSAAAVAEIVAQAVIDAVTASGGVTAAPATIVASVAMDAVILTAGADTAPATIVAAATLDAVTVTAGGTAVPAAILVVVTIDPVTAINAGFIILTLLRMYTIRAEDRTLTVTLESRTLSVRAVDRTDRIPAAVVRELVLVGADRTLTAEAP